MSLSERLREKADDVAEYMAASQAARQENRRDRRQGPGDDHAPEDAVQAAIDWLGRAQDSTASRDQGVARHYGLNDGWADSYPETTGYIVPTMLDYGARTGDQNVTDRGRRMLDWLVSIQFADGGFQGGMIKAKPLVPVTFNTGQILLGLASGEKHLGGYAEPMHNAARWLAESLDDDGCWRKHPTPFADPGEKAYETHVAWGLLEAARVAPDKGYGEAGLRNNDWALTKQRDNGFFDDCCLTDPTKPLTHTIGYVLRGVMEAYRWSGDGKYLVAGRKTADGVLGAMRDDGYLPGRLTADWRGAVNWVCLTGSVQIAYCWLMLYLYTGDESYRGAARRAITFVRRTMRLDGPDETRGAVKGAFPVSGNYGRYEYLNWAAKFYIDAQLLEMDIDAGRDIDIAKTGQ